MQLSQFLDLLRYILSFIEKSQVLAEYSAVLNVINQLKKKARSEVQVMEVKEILKKLDSFHSDIDSENKNELFSAALAIIDQHGTLGSRAMNELHKATAKMESDLQPLVKCIGKLRDETEQLLNRVNADIRGMEQIVALKAEVTSLPVTDASHLFSIEFSRQANIDTMADLEKNARIWNSILQAFITVTRSDSADVQIYSISKHRIEIHANDRVISSITKGLTSILNSYHKTLDILKLQLEIYQLKLARNREIDILLREEMKDLLEVNSVTVAHEITNQYEWAGDQAEEDLYLLVQVSLKQVFGFFEKGGRINAQISGELNDLNMKISQVITELDNLKSASNISEFKEDSVIQTENPILSEEH